VERSHDTNNAVNVSSETPCERKARAVTPNANGYLLFCSEEKFFINVKTVSVSRFVI
jgi:hypothetical protein